MIYNLVIFCRTLQNFILKYWQDVNIIRVNVTKYLRMMEPISMSIIEPPKIRATERHQSCLTLMNSGSPAGASPLLYETERTVKPHN